MIVSCPSLEKDSTHYSSDVCGSYVLITEGLSQDPLLFCSIVMRFLDIVAGTSLVLVIASVIALLFLWPIKMRLADRKRKISRVFCIITLAAAVAIALSTSWISQHIAHDEVIGALDSVPNSCQVFVNGQPILNPGAIVSSLRTLNWLDPHHSNPTQRVVVRLIWDSQDLVLSLARDSTDPREYWVFYPKYKITASNEIGRIRTNELDGY